MLSQDGYYVSPCAGLCNLLPSRGGSLGGSHWTRPGGSGGGRGPGAVPNCGTEMLGTEVDDSCNDVLMQL